MIEKMHHLSLLLFYTEKKRILRGLQDLGVVDLNLTASESPRIRRSLQHIVQLKKSIAQIEKAHAENRGVIAQDKLAMPYESAAQIALVRSLVEEKEKLENALRELSDEYELYKPWGEIPVEALANLAQHGIHVHLFSGSEKFFDRFDFGEHCVEVIARGNNTVRFALITFVAEAPVIPFQKYPIPGLTLAEIQTEIHYLENKLASVRRQLASLYSGINKLRHSLARLETRKLFETAKHSLEADATRTVYCITGYFPESQSAKVMAFLENNHLAYEVSNPQPADIVPVHLKNNRIAALFEPITRIFSLPNYRELDPTPFFAPFFTLFFGFCLGDVGYGALMAIAAFFFLVHPQWRHLGFLALILSAATMASGLLLNTFFGANLFVRDGVGLLAMPQDPAIFAAHTVQGKTTFPALSLSLLLGCVQLLLAFVVRAINAILQSTWRAAIKPVAMLFLVFAGLVLATHANFLGIGLNSTLMIGPLPIGNFLVGMPQSVAQAVLILALLLFFFFGNGAPKIWQRPLVGLWDFYGFATGFLGDFLSYIRLFALALAGGLLGNAFNQIAFMLLPRSDSGVEFLTPWILPVIVILVIGHALNFALGVLGAFVHPLRLTFVEFYKNIHFRGGGRPYRPFRRMPSAI